MREIEKIIIERIREKGKISYEEFIEISLYYPGLGYYYRSSPGKKGDFFTSPTSSSLFGYVIANFIIKISEFFGGNIEILELGGGEGFLAKDILNFIKKRSPFLWKRINYKIFEIFERESLNEKISYLPSLDSFNEFNGLIIANEFFDSLPFRVIENYNGKIKEVYINYDGEFFEELDEISEEVSEYLRIFPLELDQGERGEVRFKDWKFMKNILKKLKKGGILIIDYGSEKPELSTYRAFKGHRVYNDIISEPGERDITSDVNFNLLKRTGEEEGLETLFLITQEEFLLKNGILEIIERESEGISESLKNQAKILLSPEFMGERFKVLFQWKGISEFETLKSILTNF